jgi:multiple sugar transport system permease protein
MAPALVGFAVFIAYPIAMSLFYSFTDFNGIFIRKTGVFNFKDIFDFSRYGFGREVFRSFGITSVYAVILIPVNMVLSYALALALRKGIPGIKGIRLLFYLPVLIPGIVGGQIWTDMLLYPTGLVNQWLTNLGLPKQTFFVSDKTVIPTLLLMAQWGVGGGMILWLATLGNISPALYEAADIDGAGFFSKLRRITIPLSTPIILYNLITSLIGILQIFDTYAFIGRGMNDSAYFISIRIYVTAFGDAHQYGLSCAIAWVLFAVIAALTAVMFRTSKWVFYGDK